MIHMEEFEHREKPPVTKEERAVRKEKARIVAEENLAQKTKDDEAFRANFERLKAERKARDQLAKPGGTASVS